jgi:hypothetical protein
VGVRECDVFVCVCVCVCVCVVCVVCVFVCVRVCRCENSISRPKVARSPIASACTTSLIFSKLYGQ